MNELKYQIRYALPLWLIALLTEWLPENRISQSLRGALIGRVVGARSSLRVARGVNLVNVRDLAIGEGVYLGPYVWVNALGGVVIEDDVMLGPFVCIATTTHGFAAGSVRAGGVHVEAVRIGRGELARSPRDGGRRRRGRFGQSCRGELRGHEEHTA